MAVVKGSLEGMVKRLFLGHYIPASSIESLLERAEKVGGGQQLFQEEKVWSRLSLERAWHSTHLANAVSPSHSRNGLGAYAASIVKIGR